jgi:hypothetical protein
MLTYQAAAKWLNDNQGVLGLTLFAVTLGLGWLSGIFAALRRKPKFKFHLIPGPTFCCTYPTGAVHNNHTTHRTAFALYLAIANVGSAASSIESVAIGYHCHLLPFSWNWLRYRLGWFWLRDQVAVIHDFQAKIGENIKIYPFLMQSSILSRSGSRTFLQPGESTNGVVYFEQSDSWGGFFPSPGSEGIRIKVALRDTFGGRHTTKFTIEAVSMEHALTYNPSFGRTFAELRGQPLPHDAGDV